LLCGGFIVPFGDNNNNNQFLWKDPHNISLMVIKQAVEGEAIYPEKISSAQSLSGIGSIKILPT